MQSDYERLIPYVTNINSDVFCLRNLPEVVKGTLFSRYSRSDKSLKQILLNEFLPEDISSTETDTLADINKAQEFYDRVLIGFGDDSVAELGGAHLACENISSIAALALEDSRIGISFLEKSKIDFKEVGLLPKTLREADIINRVGGGDLTKGSCSSLAFMYAGNKAGLDVLDFRDGNSRSVFIFFEKTSYCPIY